jgi:ADP-ribose pyrophosphatase YjhB (NUDIX family)
LIPTAGGPNPVPVVELLGGDRDGLQPALPEITRPQIPVTGGATGGAGTPSPRLRNAVHIDTDITNSPGRRIGALALIRNPAGAILMVKPTYKNGWIMPGGCARADEHAYAACARKVREETGLPLTPGRLLVVDYIPCTPQTGSAEGYDFVYDGGIAPEGIAITLPKADADEQPELSAWEYLSLYDLHKYALPHHERRIRKALAALEDGRQPRFLVQGREAEIFS